ncbi:MAG TPA: hypothetical protein VGE02_02880 [Gemmatimonadales bacterium]
MSEERNQSASVLALGQLRTLVHRLADEAAGFRRRALQAEQRLKALDDQVASAGPSAAGGEVRPVAELISRVEELERENEELRRRLAEAAERTRQLLERTRFLRQQQEQEEPRS